MWSNHTSAGGHGVLFAGKGPLITLRAMRTLPSLPLEGIPKGLTQRKEEEEKDSL